MEKHNSDGSIGAPLEQIASKPLDVTNSKEVTADERRTSLSDSQNDRQVDGNMEQRQNKDQQEEHIVVATCEETVVPISKADEASINIATTVVVDEVVKVDDTLGFNDIPPSVVSSNQEGAPVTDNKPIISEHGSSMDPGRPTSEVQQPQPLPKVMGKTSDTVANLNTQVASSPTKTRSSSVTQLEEASPEMLKQGTSVTMRQISSEPLESQGPPPNKVEGKPQLQKTESVLSDTQSGLTSTESTCNRQKPQQPMDFENLKQQLNQLAPKKTQEGLELLKAPAQSQAPSSSHVGIKHIDSTLEDQVNLIDNQLSASQSLVRNGSGSDTAIQLPSHETSIITLHKAQSQPVLHSSPYQYPQSQTVVMQPSEIYQQDPGMSHYNTVHGISGQVRGMMTSPLASQVAMNPTPLQPTLALMGQQQAPSSLLQTQIILQLIQNQLINQQQQHQHLVQALIALVQHQTSQSNYPVLHSQQQDVLMNPALQLANLLPTVNQQILYPNQPLHGETTEQHALSPEKVAQMRMAADNHLQQFMPMEDQLPVNTSVPLSAAAMSSLMSQSPQHTFTGATATISQNPPKQQFVNVQQLVGLHTPDITSSLKKRPEPPPNLANLEQALIEKLHTGAKKGLFPVTLGTTVIAGTPVMNTGIVEIQPQLPMNSGSNQAVPIEDVKKSVDSSSVMGEVKLSSGGANENNSLSSVIPGITSLPAETTAIELESTDPKPSLEETKVEFKEPTEMKPEGTSLNQDDQGEPLCVENKPKEVKEDKAAVNKKPKKSRFSVTRVKDNSKITATDCDKQDELAVSKPADIETSHAAETDANTDTKEKQMVKKKDKTLMKKRGRFQVTSVSEKNETQKTDDKIVKDTANSMIADDNVELNPEARKTDVTEQSSTMLSKEGIEKVAIKDSPGEFVQTSVQNKTNTAIEAAEDSVNVSNTTDMANSALQAFDGHPIPTHSTNQPIMPVSVASTSSASAVNSSSVSNYNNNSKMFTCNCTQSNVSPHISSSHVCTSHCVQVCRLIKPNDLSRKMLGFVSEGGRAVTIPQILSHYRHTSTHGSHSPSSLLSEYSTTSLSPDHHLSFEKSQFSSKSPLHVSPSHFQPIYKHQRSPSIDLVSVTPVVKPEAKKSPSIPAPPKYKAEGPPVCHQPVSMFDRRLDGSNHLTVSHTMPASSIVSPSALHVSHGNEVLVSSSTPHHHPLLSCFSPLCSLPSNVMYPHSVVSNPLLSQRPLGYSTQSVPGLQGHKHKQHHQHHGHHHPVVTSGCPNKSSTINQGSSIPPGYHHPHHTPGPSTANHLVTGGSTKVQWIPVVLDPVTSAGITWPVHDQLSPRLVPQQGLQKVGRPIASLDIVFASCFSDFPCNTLT